MSKRNRRLTAPKKNSGFNRSHSKSISLTTTKRRLRQAGLSGRIAVRKPLLQIGNKKKRLQWVIDHRNRVIDHQWVIDHRRRLGESTIDRRVQI